MAIIYSYPVQGTIKTTDQFVVSVAPSAGIGSFETKSITYETVRDSILNAPIISGVISLSALNSAPASATATGTTGEIRITDTYIYVCVATDTWKRTELTTW